MNKNSFNSDLVIKMFGLLLKMFIIIMKKLKKNLL